jgi:hypothetical protein
MRPTPFEPQSLGGDTSGFDETEQREWGSLLQLRKHHMWRVGRQQPELRTRAGQFVDLAQQIFGERRQCLCRDQPAHLLHGNAVDEQGRVAAVAEAFAVSGHDQAVVLYRGFRGDTSNDACNFNVPLMRCGRTVYGVCLVPN